MRLPKEINPELLMYGALGVGALVLVGLIASGKAGTVGQTLAKGATDLAGGVAGGVVIGIGDQLGLPDTSDAQTVSEGRAAVARGDWLTASFKLPAAEFIAAIKNRIFGGDAGKSTAAATTTNSTNNEPGGGGYEIPPIF